MPRPHDSVRVGVIADTHGVLRPEAVRALRTADHIIHAGDIGAPEVLHALRAVAPVTAVRGNNDRGAWARGLRETETLEIGGVRLHVVHDVGDLTLDPSAAGIDVVIAGHSHRPSLARRGGVLFLNPGSAGPRRFTLPVSVARSRPVTDACGRGSSRSLCDDARAGRGGRRPDASAPGAIIAGNAVVAAAAGRS